MVGLDGAPVGGHAHSLEGLGDDGLTDGYDDIVTGDAELGHIGADRLGTAVAAIGADDLGLCPQSGHLALLVHLNVGGSLKGQDLAALSLGFLDLLGQGGHI